MSAVTLRLVSLAGPFKYVGSSEHATLEAAQAAVEAHIAGSGYSGIKCVLDSDGCSFRFTAKTPGGRGGRNVAFADVGGDFR